MAAGAGPPGTGVSIKIILVSYMMLAIRVVCVCVYYILCIYNLFISCVCSFVWALED